MEENREKSIVNKVVVVTGGSRGIGAQIVKTLANENYKVILNYNNSKEQAEKIQQELLEQGKEIEIIKADVSKKEEAEKLIQFAINKFNKIDILINNAGISQEGLFTDVTEEEWQKIINTNLNSVFYCNQQALKYMIQEQQGCIINISSIWGETGASCEVAYSTTKAAINGMTKALAKEVGPSNIRVNAIAPGIIDTDMNKNLTIEEHKQIKEQIPLNRIGKAIDIAKCVKWLVEDEYTTGQIISINGGWYI
ncbi:oxidoreductase short chain dehydrogenase/reductase family protein [Clostridium sp. CAG:508]|jgi:3-oxoacyl-[acyl-carrier protein] reductase|nr:oxidoreductase short chain dehydrogenase/reductase family protein [Clostridium sp. CAG:508]